MKCQECGEFFSMYPCPKCGAGKPQSSESESRMFRPSEMNRPIVSDPTEKLIRPSERIARSDNRDPDQLVRPSERFKRTQTESSSFSRTPSQFSNQQFRQDRFSRPSQQFGSSSAFRGRQQEEEEPEEEALVKPTQLRSTTEVAPTASMQRVKSTINKTQARKVSQRVEEVKRVSDKEIDDTEFRERVRDTLEEVMELLKNLVE